MGENATWALVAAVALAYIAQRRLDPKQTALAAVPSAQVEVDPTRWRHTGEQTPFLRDGNRRPNDETFETEKELMKTLAF